MKRLRTASFMDRCCQWEACKDCSYSFDKDDKRSDCDAVLSVAVSERSANGMFK